MVKRITQKVLATISRERIISKIFLIRGTKVMIDRDLAELYRVSTSNFNKAVKRNAKRFPKDFMFQLNKKEYDNLRFQIGTSRWGGRRYLPYVFTEQGVAMLPSVLNSERAIQVNIQIVRTFVRLRELLATNEKLRRKIENMEMKYDKQLKAVFEVMKYLVAEKIKPKEQLGFKYKK